jgi:hypothetical protein
LTSLHPIITPLALKICGFSCKSGSPLEYPVGTKIGLKMVGNTPEMRFKASKIEHRKAKNAHFYLVMCSLNRTFAPELRTLGAGTQPLYGKNNSMSSYQGEHRNVRNFL